MDKVHTVIRDGGELQLIKEKRKSTNIYDRAMIKTMPISFEEYKLLQDLVIACQEFFKHKTWGEFKGIEDAYREYGKFKYLD